ncbi:MAG: hypothetical protein WDO72_06495 [Pseudomonadota bacterium]
MTPDLQTLLIAIVFAAQIYVLSFYTPMRWQGYHARLFEKFPREEYPSLHPLLREELERKFALFRPTHLVIGAGSILAFLGALIFADSARGLAGPMMTCLLLQVMLPIYIALPLEFRIQKGLRAMPPPSRRSVELRKWRITDFVSPVWVGFGIAVQALNLACAVAVYLYRPGTLGTFPAGIGSGVMLLAMVYVLFGGGNTVATRADPFMSQADTFDVRRRIYRGLFVVSAAFGVVGPFTLLGNAGLVHFVFDYQAVCLSVTLQLVGLMLVSGQNRDLNTRDFSVYRADGSAQVAR